MLQVNSQADPIVEILQLAYRRGLAVRQEQAKKKSKIVNEQPLAGETLTAERKTSQKEDSEH